MKHSVKSLFLAVFSLLAYSASAQQITLEGYFYEYNNSGYVKDLKAKVMDSRKMIIAESSTDATGKVIFEGLERGKSYIVRGEHSLYYKVDTTIQVPADAESKIFLKFPLVRLPGYIFEGTISELVRRDIVETDGLDSVKVEIYNNTTKKEELVLNATEKNMFNFKFEQGNQYYIMLRKKGYFTKRLKANINVAGCLMCFEGFGTVTPNMVDNLTRKNTAGVLTSNIQMKKILLGEAIKLENIYYDYAKANIRPDAAKELDKLVAIMKDNPQLIIELGSHTDSRGGAPENMSLSERRAKSAVEYVISRGIDRTRISGKGYGETVLTNKCADGVQCSEEQHQENRRTEFKVVKVMLEDPNADRSLKQIVEEEEFMNQVINGGVETIEIKGDTPIEREIDNPATPMPIPIESVKPKTTPKTPKPR
jgi:outer membrane protein OmpA-like peptidoglycan-associated protein